MSPRLPFKLSAVIFDMDGLMLDSEVIARTAWRQALAEQGRTLSDDFFNQMLGRTTDDTRTLLRQAFGPELPVEALVQRKRQYVMDEVAQHGMPVKAGLWELLEWLESQSIAKAVASSARREDVEQKLVRAGLQGRFDAVVTGDQVEHGKPAPDIFLAAARQVRAPSGECVVLEDSDVGLQAAHAAGMWPLMVPDLKPPSAESRVWARGIFATLSEVKNYLAAERPAAGPA